ncbi:MAG: hypothetical protein QOG30_701, partial [Acidimicrobiaceae bacterium]
VDKQNPDEKTANDLSRYKGNDYQGNLQSKATDVFDDAKEMAAEILTDLKGPGFDATLYRRRKAELDEKHAAEFESAIRFAIQEALQPEAVRGGFAPAQLREAVGRTITMMVKDEMAWAEFCVGLQKSDGNPFQVRVATIALAQRVARKAVAGMPKRGKK